MNYPFIKADTLTAHVHDGGAVHVLRASGTVPSNQVDLIIVEARPLPCFDKI